MRYQIVIEGGLDQSWVDWLGDVRIDARPQADGGTLTTLMGDFPDQAALFGILDRVRDLNLALVSVNPLAP
jgi:hypothetical protein